MAASIRQFVKFIANECQTIVRDLRIISSLYHYNYPKLDIDYVTVSDPITSGKLSGKHDASLSILDSIFSNLLLAVQRDRRSLERRMTRRMQLPGHFEYAIPKKNIVPCLECGHFHEKGSICGHCYSKVQEETKKMMTELGEDMRYTADQKEVVFLYEGEENEHGTHQGKHIVEMKKARPPWFPKSLMTKSVS